MAAGLAAGESGIRAGYRTRESYAVAPAGLSQPITAPQLNRPTSAPPVSTPPISSPPLPGGRPGPQPPQILRPQPPVARPVAPPVQLPPVRAAQAQRHKRWYTEPVVIGTVIVLLLVVLAFMLLLTTAFS